ncbi:hypothetical protein [Oceanobacillus oncorhynchi]|uniref:hypothetical protein n=1 Tax=Oceanobacillus oncorhynchi TaxID=545501 RepID=UPI0018677352|nr:hypothetical protein [Oceanobacillus oncorhynchi]
MRIEFQFELKDGTIIDSVEEYPPTPKGDIFYGLSNSFKNNASLNVTDKNGASLSAKFADDVKSVKVTFD